MTDVKIVKRKEKDSPDKYWHIVCMSGVSEAKFGEFKDAESYCNDSGYTYELAVDDRPEGQRV